MYVTQIEPASLPFSVFLFNKIDKDAVRKAFLLFSWDKVME